MRIEKKGERERCKDRCYRNRNGYRWPGIVPSGCCTFVGDELLDLELCWLGGAGYENELNPMGAGVTALVSIYVALCVVCRRSCFRPHTK